MKNREFIFDKYPLATIMISALLVRLLAVIYSKGYMASDDHFETIAIAYDWLRYGVFNSDGLLAWAKNPPSELNRFPLYNLILLGQMKILRFFGVVSLDNMMYFIRAVHAILSLIPVYIYYRLTLDITKSAKFALIAGLVGALHFGVPFLSVRNLIEVVGGHFWIVAIYAIYKYQFTRTNNWLITAGLFTGLAWMVRFQIALAVIPVPFLLWFQYRELKPVIYYSLSVFLMILISALSDYWLLGKFAGTTISLIFGAINGQSMYNTTVFIYPLEIIFFFIPPLSIILIIFAFKKKFWNKHLILTISTLSFIVFHTMLSNRQERFMIPIIPVLILIFIFTLWHQYKEKIYLFKNKKMYLSIISFTLIVNFTLLILFTFNFWHKGLVEPMSWIEQNYDSASPAKIAFVSPTKRELYPFDYAGYTKVDTLCVFDWDELGKIKSSNFIADYYVIYPPNSNELKKYKEIIESEVGSLREIYYSSPSRIDRILHYLNPRHNAKNEAWIFRSKQ
ncbi:MAG: glycosyltransferase family 39 protein [candidate division Zixibacteria bacterium]|nr:glycosyltransferase family 39 protein [candidate division Zixibacteria bacterium]